MGLLGAVPLELLVRRLAALTTATLLALTLAPAAPALAAASADAQAREQAARTLRADGDVPLRGNRQIILDPAGDAENFGGRRRDARAERLADLRRVSYATPTQDDGIMTVRARWELLRGAAESSPRQVLVTLMFNPRTQQIWFLEVTNRGRAVLSTIEEDGDEIEEVRIRPETFDLAIQRGAGGEMTVRMSTEWLEVKRLRFLTFGQSGPGVDRTGVTDRLFVGSAPGNASAD